MASNTADDILWNEYATISETRNPILTVALSRINFAVEMSVTPLRAVVDLSSAMSVQNPSKTITIFLGRSRRMAVESHQVELQQITNEAPGFMSSSVSKTLGDVGAAVVAKGICANLFVMQAASSS